MADETEDEKINYDKIFGNEYGSTESDFSPTKFTISDSHREKKFDENIDEFLVKDLVLSLMKENTKFSRFCKPDIDGGYPKVNKSEINEIYSYAITNLMNLPRIEIFSILSDLYDISPEKFYESLSNSFKTELIIELRNRGHLKKRNFLF